MKIKKNVQFTTSDFWYDISKGGYINPEKILSDKKDIKRVTDAIQVIEEFESSCEDQIEGFRM